MVMNSDVSNILTKNRAEQMKHMVEEFINNKTNNLAVLNVSDAQTILDIFKSIYDETTENLISNISSKEEEIEKLKLQLQNISNKVYIISLLFRLHNYYVISSQAKVESKESSRSKTSSRKFKSQLQQSVTEEKIPKKSSKIGSIADNSGKSLGKARKGSKEGTSSSDRIEKGKFKSKINRKKTIMESTSQYSKLESEEVDVDTFLFANIKTYEDMWKAFTEQDSYENLQNSFKKAIADHQETLDKYHDLCKKVESNIQKLEDKKDYQMKVSDKLNNFESFKKLYEK